MKVRAVIEEDELPALEKLRTVLEALPGVEVLGVAQDGQRAAELIRELRPDVAFLDIRMPKVSGLSVVASLKDPPEIVFVTAYSKHAVAAFELRAFDYLLKPYTSERVQSVVERLQEHLKLVRLAEVVKSGTHITSTEQGGEGGRLLLKSGNEMVIVEIKDVECAIAEANYVHIMTTGRKFFLRGVLSELESMLPQGAFMRTHRSAIANINLVKSLLLEDRELVTVSGFRVPVSGSRIDQVLDALKSAGLPMFGQRNDS